MVGERPDQDAREHRERAHGGAALLRPLTNRPRESAGESPGGPAPGEGSNEDPCRHHAGDGPQGPEEGRAGQRGEHRAVPVAAGDDLGRSRRGGAQRQVHTPDPGAKEGHVDGAAPGLRRRYDLEHHLFGAVGGHVGVGEVEGVWPASHQRSDRLRDFGGGGADDPPTAEHAPLGSRKPLRHSRYACGRHAAARLGHGRADERRVDPGLARDRLDLHGAPPLVRMRCHAPLRGAVPEFVLALALELGRTLERRIDLFVVEVYISHACY